MTQSVVDRDRSGHVKPLFNFLLFLYNEIHSGNNLTFNKIFNLSYNVYSKKLNINVFIVKITIFNT